MLIDTRIIVPNSIDRFTRWGFNCPIAADVDTGATLHASGGRRKAGRGRRYYVKVPASLLPAGYYDQELAGITIIAHTDAEAIQRANERLVKEAR